MNPRKNRITSICSRSIGFWVIVLSLFHVTGNSSCAFLHLDKNYLYPGEELSGTLFTNKCGRIFPQVRIFLFDNSGEPKSESWIRLDSSIQPFKLEVPAGVPEGLYQLVVMIERSQKVIYSQTLPLFKPDADLHRLDSVSAPNPDVVTQAKGLGIEVAHSIAPGAKLELVINQKSANAIPAQASVRISDLAQSEEVPLPTGQADARLIEEMVPLSSHTFALEGYLSDSAGNGCNYCHLILTIPKLEEGVYYTRTDATGSFAFTGLTHSETLKAYLSYTPDPTDPVKQFFVHSKTPQYRPEITGEDISAYKQRLADKIGRYTLSRAFNQSKDTTMVSTEKPMRPYQEILLYPKYDEQVIFDQYFLGPDMKKTIKSIVPFVNTIKKQQLRVFSVENSRTFPEAPLILLDGIPINSQKALSLDPRTIYKVEVLHRRRTLRQVGNLASNGVISLFTKNGTDETDIIGVKKIYIKGFDNLSAKRLQKSTYHSFDRVLYWNPSMHIESGSKISFDLPEYYAELLISIIGVNEQGEFVFYQGSLKE